MRTQAPVYHRASGTIIGNATCEAGALAVVRRAHIPKLEREHWTATLADRLIEPDDPDGEVRWEPTWFVGVQLR